MVVLSVPGSPIVLPPLPWERNALEPHISEETISFHYGKHHAGYVRMWRTCGGAHGGR